MIAAECRGCGSENIRKNGTAPAGCKKIHCRNCSFCSASDIETEEREACLKTAENLQTERLSQRGTARTLRMIRIKIRKKMNNPTASSGVSKSKLKTTSRPKGRGINPKWLNQSVIFFDFVIWGFRLQPSDPLISGQLSIFMVWNKICFKFNILIFNNNSPDSRQVSSGKEHPADPELFQSSTSFRPVLLRRDILFRKSP